LDFAFSIRLPFSIVSTTRGIIVFYGIRVLIGLWGTLGVPGFEHGAQSPLPPCSRLCLLCSKITRAVSSSESQTV